jgi:alcohol dehydrogenase class IV
LTGDQNASALDGVAWVHNLVSTLQISPLATYGMSQADFPEAVEKTMKANSFKGNPIALTREELTTILEQAI